MALSAEITLTPSRISFNELFTYNIAITSDATQTYDNRLVITLPDNTEIKTTNEGTIIGNTAEIDVGTFEVDETKTYTITGRTETAAQTDNITAEISSGGAIPYLSESTEMIIYSLKFVGYFPQDLELSQGFNTSCLIQFGDSLKEPLHGNVKDVTQEVVLYVYSNINQKNVSIDQITLIENILNDIKEELLDDFTLSGTIQCIQDIETERGGLLETFDYQTAGYTANMNLTKMYINLKYREE
jgi:hypothetical protein